MSLLQKYARVPSVPRQQAVTISTEAEKEARIDASLRRAGFAGMGLQSHSGRRVTLESAMELSAVWSCIRVTAETIASLPLHVYRKSEAGGTARERVDDRFAEILTESPNATMTALEYWEGQVAWLCADGNCYAERINTGSRLSALQPLAAGRVEPIQNDDGRISFEYFDRGKREILPADKVLHIRGFGFGGLRGLSPIRYGLQSMGAGLAADETAGKFFANGLQLSGILETDQGLTEEQRAQLQGHLEHFAGSRRAWKTLILEMGLKWNQVSLDPVDAQLLETRRFTIEDVCRWFGVPPIIIGHASDGQTMWGTGVEQIMLGWMTKGLNPMIRRIEAASNRHILRPASPGAYMEFTREGILQMDTTSKGEFLRQNVVNGIMTPNEARQKLNLPPIAGGDTLLVQGAMVTLEELFNRNTGET